MHYSQNSTHVNDDCKTVEFYISQPVTIEISRGILVQHMSEKEAAVATVKFQLYIVVGMKGCLCQKQG